MIASRVLPKRPSSLAGRAALAVCVVALSVGGCHKQQKSASKEEAKPLVKTADRGPIKLTVTASRDQVTIAETIDLAIEVDADPGIEVHMPEFGMESSGLQVDDFQQPSADDLPAGRKRYRQVYKLDAFVSGDYNIPSITAKYVDRRTAKQGASSEKEPVEAELSTEPFTIKVTSLLEGEFDPQSFRDVKGVVTLEPDLTWAWLWWVGGGAAGVAVFAVAIALLVKRARRPRRVVVVAPHEWALEQLRELVNAQLVENGKIKEFYYRLNEITRTYIELRFGLQAPERTTEEFLAELRHSPYLPADRKRRLEAFLEACDLVKYALHKPGTEEIEQVFDAARDFVMDTSPTAGDTPDSEMLTEVAA